MFCRLWMTARKFVNKIVQDNFYLVPGLRPTSSVSDQQNISDTASTCYFLHNLQIDYFHKVPVTLHNDFQCKRNLTLRSYCHMIIEATCILQ
jgi:hypothetical protein